MLLRSLGYAFPSSYVRTTQACFSADLGLYQVTVVICEAGMATSRYLCIVRPFLNIASIPPYSRHDVLAVHWWHRVESFWMGTPRSHTFRCFLGQGIITDGIPQAEEAGGGRFATRRLRQNG